MKVTIHYGDNRLVIPNWRAPCPTVGEQVRIDGLEHTICDREITIDSKRKSPSVYYQAEPSELRGVTQVSDVQPKGELGRYVVLGLVAVGGVGAVLWGVL